MRDDVSCTTMVRVGACALLEYNSMHHDGADALLAGKIKVLPDALSHAGAKTRRS